MSEAYLIVDSSTRYGAVGLWVGGAADGATGGTLVRTQTWFSKNNHTSELLPAVDGVLSAGGVTPVRLAGIAVASGPGGFSALRAGLGLVKGLAFAAGLPVIGVSTIEASAYPHRGVGLPICAVIEAGRGAVAWARFVQGDSWKRRTPDRVTSLESMLAAKGRHTLFCGEGAGVHADAIRESLGAKAHVIVETTPVTRLAGVAALGVARLQAGEAESVAALRPRYLRAPSITPPKAPRVVPPQASRGRKRGARS